jgi:hypothetical protein
VVFKAYTFILALISASLIGCGANITRPSDVNTVIPRSENADRTKEPLLKVWLPSEKGTSELYYVQPVNVTLINADEPDGLVDVRIDVISNPPGHQHALSASFAAPARVTHIGTRLRLTGKGGAVVQVVAHTRAGQEITATGKIQVDEGVDFSDESSLTKRLPMAYGRVNGPIGTTYARLKGLGEYDRQLSALAYHPMLPRIGGHGPNRFESLQIQYRGTLLGQIEFGDAMSNDPYIDVRFVDQQSGSGPTRLQWKDNAGRTFEPKEVIIR